MFSVNQKNTVVVGWLHVFPLSLSSFFSYLVVSIHFSDQGNLQGPKGLKAKRSREYFEVKHLGVEKKKRGRKRKSEYILPAEPNSILTRPLVDNGISLPGAVFTVVEEIGRASCRERV